MYQDVFLRPGNKMREFCNYRETRQLHKVVNEKYTVHALTQIYSL